MAGAQAAGGYVEYDSIGGYTLPPQTVALTDDSVPHICRVSFRSPWEPCRLAPHHRGGTHGEGVGWHEHNHDVFEGCERFFRPGYNANLVPRGCRRSTAS